MASPSPTRQEPFRKPCRNSVKSNFSTAHFQQHWLLIISAHTHTEFAVCQLTFSYLQAFLAPCDTMASQGYLHTSQEHLSADQPPQASVLSTRGLNAANQHSCPNDSTKPVRTQSLVLFPPLHLFKLCNLSSVFTPVLGGRTNLSRRVVKKGAGQSLTYMGAQIMAHYSGVNLPKGLTFQHHSCESLNILFETLSSLWDMSIHGGKFVPPSHVLS